MPRSIWNGTISFGLVNVPIRLYSATQPKAIRFHELHARDLGRIEHRRFCSQEDREVPYSEVVKGYEVAPDTYVVLTKEEVAAADPSGGKVIAIEDFVDGGEIDPVYYEHTYYVGARERGERAYRLLREALERSGRVGVGRFTFHNKEQLVGLRVLDGVLALHTMRYHDEVVRGEELEIPEPQRPPTEREAEMAETLVSSLESEFRPERYEDTYRERVLALIEAKARGERVELPRPEEGVETPDLLSALESSVRAGRSRRKAATR